MKYQSSSSREKASRLTFIGAGAVATALATTLTKKKYPVVQVISRTIKSARLLAEKTGARHYSDNFRKIKPADIIFICVPDDSIPSVIRQIRKLKTGSIEFPSPLLVHTSGSTLNSELSSPGYRIACLYPLQTFTKSMQKQGIHNSLLRATPLFIEAEKQDASVLLTLAKDISNKVLRIKPEERLIVHLGAVFAHNFSNHMFTLSKRILEQKGGRIKFKIYVPLLKEMMRKIAKGISPEDIQTGPAKRKDFRVIRKHIQFLKKHPIAGAGILGKIYTLVSESIRNNQT